MAELPSGYLVFVVSNTLATVHSLASQIGRLKSDAHLLDVGLLAKDAWMSAWLKDEAAAVALAKQVGGEFVALSANGARALMSLGPSLDDETKMVGLLEISNTEGLADFFRGVAECERCGWSVLEIRIRKSGPAGAHAFFSKSTSSKTPAVKGFIELAAEGDYRKFF